MVTGWNELTGLTAQKPFLVTRIKLKENGIAIEGEFELPPLASLSYEDQVFVAMFVRLHGSIKDMEQAFGVSYPTIKARLNRVADQFGFLKVSPVAAQDTVLDQLERGEITAKEAMERLKQ